MYHPTTRLLTILELLQTYPTLSGAELARRLEVEPRSIRRYVLMLQDMGIPIEAIRGPGGGYQLRPGFKLPPLMFTDDEATAIVLGLLGSGWLEIGQSSLAVEGALAKVLRVLPLRTRERLNAVSSHLILSPYEQEARPDVALLITLSDAIQQQQRVDLIYRSEREQSTQRTVEPYGVAGWWGRWYLVAFCCLRQGYRLFRLDRMEQVQVLTESFVRAAGFDEQAYLQEQLIGTGASPQIEIEFQATLQTVQGKIPAHFGSLTATAQGVLFQSQHGDVLSTARYLVGLNLPFVVHQPHALREALLHLAEQMIQSATAQHLPDNPGDALHQPTSQQTSVLCYHQPTVSD
ncbi:MAG: YafY family transcriptional regulator [Roseiflexaceae bacterium]|nr:YafY family transcriptional regulator [Roseiflexaceae bacterium]